MIFETYRRLYERLNEYPAVERVNLNHWATSEE